MQTNARVNIFQSRATHDCSSQVSVNTNLQHVDQMSGIFCHANQTTADKVISDWCRPDHTIQCHSQPCQFTRVHAPAAYGGNMLSGELVSWPGLPDPGTDGNSLGPEDQLWSSRYSARTAPLTLALSDCLVASFSYGSSSHASTPLYVGGL